MENKVVFIQKRIGKYRRKKNVQRMPEGDDEVPQDATTSHGDSFHQAIGPSKFQF